MFAKVFAQIFDSSIAENPELRFTFTDLLILADSDGVVDMTHSAIARRTNRPEKVIRETIAALEQPDPHSRTPDYAGARIKRLDEHREWGWMILNYKRFREIASEEQRREKTRARVKRHRQEKAEEEEEGKSAHSVTDAFHACKAIQRQLLPAVLSEKLPPPLNAPEMMDAWDEWQLHYRQRMGIQMTERAAHQLIDRLKQWGPERAIAAIRHSISQNWKGVYEDKGRNGAGPIRTLKDITEENAV